MRRERHLAGASQGVRVSDGSNRTVDVSLCLGGAPSRRLDTLAIRVVDVVVAVAVLVLALPLLVVTAVAVRLDSPGGALYRCRRVGRGGTEFEMLKFRKMRADATGPALTAADDARFTRLGSFLARSKLDELPQLWNVLKGQMSLVGPRPESPEFVALRAGEYRSILAVPPGITGFSQLAFARESEILDRNDRVADYLTRVLPQKLRMDALYASRRSLATNLRILLWTAITLFARADVAVNRQSGRLGVRRRRAHEAPVAALTARAR
jgi:lipopolysaccharide/colanic/teichoic acid biosynthesis glycosyltransferase